MDGPLIPGLGPLELIIIFVVLGFSVLPAAGVYRIAQRAGYTDGSAVLWAIGYLVPFGSAVVPLALGFMGWPRDRVASIPPPPPPPM